MSDKKIKIIYFSTKSENTLNFVSRLTNFESERLPENGDIVTDYPYVLVFPSYGGGKMQGSIPAPVLRFIKNVKNQENIIGIIGSGDRNYGDMFCIGAALLSKKLEVPLLYRYEIRGTKEDVQKVNLGLLEIQKKLNNK